MGVDFNQISPCSRPCDCGKLGNLVLKENKKTSLDTDKKTGLEKKKNSVIMNKDNNNFTGKFFSNQIIDYINDNKSEGKNENNLSSHNNLNTYRSTNIQSNTTNKNSNYKKDSTNNKDNVNNNDNNNDIKENENIKFNNNNITVEKKEKNEDDSSIYDDNKDSFIKMEEENKNEIDKKFEKGLIQFSKIEEKSIEGKEKNQININLDNANIEDLINIIDIKEDVSDDTIIEYNGEKCNYKGIEKKKINGKGKILYRDGRIYEGIFENGMLNGNGKYISSNGDIYEGNFNKGNLSGKGTIIKSKENSNNSKEDSNSHKENSNKDNNKITYIGEIKNFKKEGNGIETCDEYKYEGFFHDDMKNGEGLLVYLSTGDKYNGHFKDDKITGYGNYVWENGDSYIGDFVNGKMHGKGIYKWLEGSIYEGEYKDNIREGKGIFKWKSGVIFEGNFLNGKPNGKGKLIYESKNIDVEYQEGKFLGDFKKTIKNLKLN